MKTKGKKTNAKVMIFEAKLQEIELIFRIILLNNSFGHLNSLISPHLSLDDI